MRKKWTIFYSWPLHSFLHLFPSFLPLPFFLTCFLLAFIPNPDWLNVLLNPDLITNLNFLFFFPSLFPLFFPQRIPRYTKVIINMSRIGCFDDSWSLDWYPIVLWRNRQTRIGIVHHSTGTITGIITTNISTTIDSKHIFPIHVTTDCHGCWIPYA